MTPPIKLLSSALDLQNPLLPECTTSWKCSGKLLRMGAPEPQTCQMGGGEQDDCQKNSSHVGVSARYPLAKRTFFQECSHCNQDSPGMPGIHRSPGACRFLTDRTGGQSSAEPSRKEETTTLTMTAAPWGGLFHPTPESQASPRRWGPEESDYETTSSKRCCRK